MIFIYNYTVRSTIISWSISHTTSALKDHTPLEAVPPELTEQEANLLGDVEEGDKDEMADVYGKQLASVKAAKIQSAQALLDKANGNGRVVKNLKESGGRARDVAVANVPKVLPLRQMPPMSQIPQMLQKRLLKGLQQLKLLPKRVQKT